MLSLLRQPKLLRFYFAHGQSQLGTGASYVALVLIAYQRLHSGWAVALVLLSEFLPGVVLAPYFGVLADRHSRRTLAIAAEVIRAGAFLGLVVISSFTATVALALLAGVGTALFRPAVNAALPGLVTPEERSPATALYGALKNLGFTLGPALCGLVVMLGPASWVLAGNAATFVISAALLAGVPLGRAGEDAGGEGAEPRSAWRDAKLGARYAARERRVGALMLIVAMTVLCGALINVAEPLLAIGPLHAGGSGFSILMTLYGLGMVAGAAYTARLGSRISVLRAHFLAGVAMTGVAMLACAAAGSLAGALAPFAIAGFANVVIINPQIRLLQELVAGQLRGRVFGLLDSLECSCFAIAFLAAGALLTAIGPRALYVLSGALLLATAVFGLGLFRAPASADAVRHDALAAAEAA
ncbi:MAG: MFS transporter [Solirubrobacterales bacterium]|nr:MFS transporter [Solirubrobacterales bacterium]